MRRSSSASHRSVAPGPPMTRPAVLVVAAALVVSIAGCGAVPGSPDPEAALCRYLTIERPLPALSLRLREAVLARDAETALAAAADMRREVERVPDDPIERTYPTNWWQLAQLIQGTTFFYRFGAGLVQKGFLERPWNEDDLRNALEMLARGDESVGDADAELRRLTEDGRQPRCSG